MFESIYVMTTVLAIFLIDIKIGSYVCAFVCVCIRKVYTKHSPKCMKHLYVCMRGIRTSPVPLEIICVLSVGVLSISIFNWGQIFRMRHFFIHIKLIIYLVEWSIKFLRLDIQMERLWHSLFIKIILVVMIYTFSYNLYWILLVWCVFPSNRSNWTNEFYHEM